VTADVERQVLLEQRKDELAAVKAEFADAQYKVDNATIVAPSDGYVVNLQLRAGEFIRIKTPVMTFVSSEEAFIFAKIPQRATRHVVPGSRAQYALEMYPGKVFETTVDHVIQATGNAQLAPSGILPTEEQITTTSTFIVKLRAEDTDPA